MTKVRRLAKLGDNLGTSVAYYIRDGGQVYRIQTDNPASPAQALGDAAMFVRTRVYRCNGSPANNRPTAATTPPSTTCWRTATRSSTTAASETS